MAKEIFTPREIISRYIDRNTTKESGTVSVRGIYSRNDDAGNLSKQWVFDKLIDELSGATLKLYMPRSLRDFIQDGQTVEMSGSISDYGFRENGTLQVQMNVSNCLQAKDLFVSKLEGDKHRLRRQKSMKGFKNVQRTLTDIFNSGRQPHILLIYPGQTVADTDFNRAIGSASQYYSFELRFVPFSDAARVVEVLKGCDGRYDLICLVRGGGSGLQHLDDIDILTQVVALQTPFITAIGHAEDNLFIDSLSDLSKETPSLLGTFFRDLVEERNKYNTMLRDQNNRYDRLAQEMNLKHKKLVRIIIGLAIALVVVAGLAYYGFTKTPPPPIQ